MIGGCYLSEASGIEEEYWAAVNNNDSIIHFDNCDIEARNGSKCEFGSSNDYQVGDIQHSGDKLKRLAELAQHRLWDVEISSKTSLPIFLCSWGGLKLFNLYLSKNYKDLAPVNIISV